MDLFNYLFHRRPYVLSKPVGLCILFLGWGGERGWDVSKPTDKVAYNQSAWGKGEREADVPFRVEPSLLFYF